MSQDNRLHDRSEARSDDSMTSLLLSEDDLQCGYSSKRCANTRTTKKGGGLHRFCEFHRRRANANQRRVDNKRRELRARRRQERKRIDAAKATAPVSITDSAKRPEMTPLKCVMLSDADIELLETVLCEATPMPTAVSESPRGVESEFPLLWPWEDASLLSSNGLNDVMLTSLIE